MGYKINTDMTAIDIAIALSDGDESLALPILNLLKNFEDRMILSLTLDHFRIYGNNIFKFFKFGCRENLQEFESVLKLFNHGYYTEDKILKNLELDSPIPFIDRAVAIKYAAMNFSGSLQDMLKLTNCGNDLKQAFEEKLDKELTQKLMETKPQNTDDSQPVDDKK